jgi:hypothetical protein
MAVCEADVMLMLVSLSLGRSFSPFSLLCWGVAVDEKKVRIEREPYEQLKDNADPFGLAPRQLSDNVTHFHSVIQEPI